MAEENQVQQEPQRVTMKDPKKVEVGKRLAANNRKRREVKKAKSEGVSQYYAIGAVIAVGMIGGLGYYIYQSKKGEESGEQPSNPQQNNPPKQQPPPAGPHTN